MLTFENSSTRVRSSPSHSNLLETSNDELQIPPRSLSSLNIMIWILTNSILDCRNRKNRSSVESGTIHEVRRQYEDAREKEGEKENALLNSWSCFSQPC